MFKDWTNRGMTEYNISVGLGIPRNTHRIHVCADSFLHQAFQPNAPVLAVA